MRPIALTATVLLLTSLLAAQSPIPVRGGGAGRQGGQGRGAAAADATALPSSPAAVSLPTITSPVGGPGAMFESLMALPSATTSRIFDTTRRSTSSPERPTVSRTRRGS